MSQVVRLMQEDIEDIDENALINEASAPRMTWNWKAGISNGSGSGRGIMA